MARRPSVTFVIMAGGRGERLWPLVRTGTPKVCLAPDGRRTLLQETVDRMRPIWPRAHWLIVTAASQAAAVRRALAPSLRSRVVVEPEGKSTAACIGLAAAIVAHRDPHGVIVAVPADHWIDGVGAFRRSVRAAIRAAVAHRTIATIGIRPTSAHSGLGYLCAGPRVNGFMAPRAFRLSRFIEKPSRAVAARLMRRAGTYWNSGLFIGQAAVILERLADTLPTHARQLTPLGAAWSRPEAAARMRAAYRRLAPISFDHGVMAHLRGGVVVEGRFTWADLGSWDVWARLGRTSTKTIGIDSKAITVIGQRGHLVATIGVRNLLIVQTPTATLICHPAKAQAVRGVVAQLWREARWAPYR